VPVITTLSADVSIYSNTTNSHILPVTNVSSGYINYHDSNSYITGIVLSKLPGTNSIQSVSFPELDTRTAFVYHNTSLANINSPNSNVNSTIISIWYGNNNPGSNVASITLSTFLAAGPPTAPRTLSISPITASNATFTYSPPEYVDSNDHSSLLTIQLYLITYFSDGSSIRYPSAIADSNSNSPHTYSNSSNLSYTVPSLYPDSLYTFAVDAQNSANQTGPFATITATTSNLTPTAALGSLTFPSRFYSGTIYNILSGTTVTNLVNSSADWTSASFITPINNVATRGKLVASNTQLMNLSTTLTIGQASTIGGAITFQGFPATTPSASAQSNLTLTATSVYDKYNASSSSYQGFFLESANTITIGSNLFTASPYNYVVSALQASTFTASASYTFQYDGAPGTPSVSITTFNFNASNYAPVSGVNVIYGSPTFSIVTSASNLGTYYYKSPLLTYTNAIVGSWTPASESNLTHIVSGNNGTRFTNPVGFSNSISINVTTTYLNSITLSVTANNVSASSSVVNATPIVAMVDGPSYTLVYTTLPQTLPTVTNNSTAVKGYHITSATAGATNVPPFLNSGSSYALTGYNNSESLAANQELQVSNGKFTAFTGQTLAYKNYTTYSYDASHSNSVNYSAITHSTGDYRYATFAWKINPVSPATYGTLIFNMVGSSAITITGNLAYANSEKIRLYYRFENAASPTPTDLSNPLTSAWIDGNLQSGTPANSTTYVTPTDYTQTQTYGLLSANTSGQFTVFIPALSITSGTNVYLYCRIGIPMASGFSFSYMTATMS
jgi:hypothetical protein